ncbi:unnamed protein product [Vitrella brassicaformis CCMP3155]|uniref:LamG-like jellyroll fold domain-containing protein n=3 Tax=Vitrella brassicaformis TaxID=1169539 RepID=A0A0G4G337_VITBC|nr:unnamed protein product [Vitrella brassicaformis CCMP3155]|eukprot:CEM22658.1 unnamed protein product [Vitrella brassicaformis CCMP3155]
MASRRRPRAAPLLRLLLLAPALFSTCVCGRKRPNFVLMFSDDQQDDAIGFVQREHDKMGKAVLYPFFRDQTPAMDRIAEEGFWFRNAYVQTSLCSPSRASILTGQYSHITGVIDNESIYPADRLNFADRLRFVGYHTAYIGKWHMGEQLIRPGFDYAASYLGQGIYQNEPFTINGKHEVGSEGYVDDIATDYAIDYLKKRAKSDQPFAMILGFKAPHEPREPPERLENLYKDAEMPEPANWFKRPFQGKRVVHFPQAEKVKYFQLLKAVDENVGRVLKTLHNLNMTDDTMVMYYSDNGYFLGSHSLNDKRLAYEEGIRIPFLLRYPRLGGGLKPIMNTILNVDIAPTILDFAGAPIPPEMNGRSFKQLLTGEADPADLWRTGFLYSYFFVQQFWGVPEVHAWREDGINGTRAAKLVIYPRDIPDRTRARSLPRSQLFLLDKDPLEMRNQIDNPDYRELKQELMEKLKMAWFTEGVMDRMVFVRGMPLKLLPMAMSQWNFNFGAADDFFFKNRGRLKGTAEIDTHDIPFEGSGDLVLDGKGYMDISHRSLQKGGDHHRAVAMDIMPDAIGHTQMLYSEGGRMNGFAMRLHGRSLQAVATHEGKMVTVSARFSSTDYTPVGFRWHGNDGQGLLSLFIHGKMVGEKKTKYATVKRHFSPATIGAWATESAFGDKADAGTRGGFFRGRIDNVRIFDGPSEATPYRGYANYEDMAAMGGITSHWSLHGHTRDLLGVADAHAEGGPAVAISRQGHRAFTLNGQTQEISIPSDVIMRGFSAMSLTLWFRPDRLKGVQYLYEEGGPETGLALQLVGSDLRAVMTNHNKKTIAEGPLPSEEPGNWHHGVFTFGHKKMSLYVDGRLLASEKVSYGRLPDHGDYGALGGVAGSGAAGLPAEETTLRTGFFQGALEDVTLYDHTLTINQIVDLYLNSRSGL